MYHNPGWAVRQSGCKFWESALREHAAAASGNRYPAFDDALSSFFRNVDTRYKPPREIKAGNGSVPIQCLKARAVLIDMEEGVVNQLLKGPLSELFDEKQYITDNSGSGNNWLNRAIHSKVFSCCTHWVEEQARALGATSWSF
ncbi:hypothetical protein Mapa_000170 [Marchantia paleacea]|nr:hypothetical protein Mapa_000170 [Marchantia paleacea]